jgi:hypothetical protein
MRLKGRPERSSRLHLTSTILGDDELQRLLFELALCCETHDGVELLACTPKRFAPWCVLIFLVRDHGNPFWQDFPRDEGKHVNQRVPRLRFVPTLSRIAVASTAC